MIRAGGSDGGGRLEPEPQKHQSIQENAENGLNEVLKGLHFLILLSR